MKVAIVYDRINKWGGAERVLLALHKIFPQAPLFTSVYDADRALWAEDFDVRTSFLQQFPFARHHHEYFALLMPLAFESFSFDDFEIVISITSESAKGVLTKPGTTHICLCLTPTRYLWSGYKEYFKNKFFSLLAKPVVAYLRSWDRVAANRPDVYIAISQTVQNRIKKYYGQESSIIFPPLMLASQYADETPEDYFLVVSRLVPYKRVDLAVRSCTALQLPLKVVGTGSEFARLKELAGPTVEFLEHVSDSQLSELYSKARALIFPGKEDFGLTMVEANAHGTPVIAYKAGGALDIIQEGRTGKFFEKQTIASLSDILKNFDRSRYNRKACYTNAEKFSFEQFEKEIRAFVENINI